MEANRRLIVRFWMRHLIVFCLAATAAFAQTEVLNGVAPKGPAYTLDLVEDLKFGPDRDDDYYFWAMANAKIIPDSRGHMYITDLKERRILEFDPAGEFVKVAASAGNGPGELQGILSMNSLADGRFVLLDGPQMGMPKLKYYDKDMGFQSEKLPVGFGLVPYSFQFSPRGDLLGANYFSMDMAAGKLQLKAGILTKDLEIKKALSAIDQKLPNMSDWSDNNWTQLIAERLKTFYQGSGAYAFDPAGNLYTAVTDRYEIAKWSPDLKPLLVVKKKYKAIPNNDAHLQGYVDMIVEGMTLAPQFQSLITETLLNNALKRSEPPTFKKPIFGMIAIEDKGLLVVHDLDMGTRQTAGDLFDTEGHFIGQVRLPDYALMSHDLGQFQPRMIFRNGFAYTLLTDEMGDNYAVRYKYRLIKLSEKGRVE